MAKEFDASPQILTGIAQTLLDAKHKAVAIEEIAEDLTALASEETDAELVDVIGSARSIRDRITKIYRSIAKEAMGEAKP